MTDTRRQRAWRQLAALEAPPLRGTQALRWALTAMLADLTYPERDKNRPWVQARLDEAGWTAFQVQSLTILALRWARQQGGGVEAQLRQALGETTTDARGIAQEPAGVMEQSSADRITSMSTIPQITTNGTEESCMDVAENTLLLKAADTLMKDDRFKARPKLIQEAVKLVERGGITPGYPEGLWHIVGSEGRHYSVNEEGCSCPNGQKNKTTKYGCYHAVGVELLQELRRLEDRHVQPTMFPPAPTVEERLAAPPRETNQEPQEGPQEAQDATQAPTDVSPAVPVPAPVLEAPRAPVASTTPPLALALPLRSIHAILADLARALPPECLGTKTQGGQEVDYVPWYTVREVLDAYAPGWCGEVRGIHEVTTVVGKKGALKSVKAWALCYRVTIPCLEGESYREAVGIEHEEEPIYGDTMTNAQATSFKRAAALFGVAADLYDKNEKGEHFTQILVQEKAALLKLLRPELERRGLNPQEVLQWLKRQTGVQRNSEISIAALKSLLAHLGVVETDPEELQS